MSAVVEFTYSLSKEEAFKAMKGSGYYKTSGKKLIAECILLGILAVYFAVSYILYLNPFNLGMTALCLLVLAMILLVPHLDMKRRASQIAQGDPIRLKVGPQKMTVSDGSSQWVIPLDGTSVCKIIGEEIITVTTKGRRLVIIPLAKIPQQMATQVQSTIYAGTLTQ